MIGRGFCFRGIIKKVHNVCMCSMKCWRNWLDVIPVVIYTQCQWFSSLKCWRNWLDVIPVVRYTHCQWFSPLKCWRNWLDVIPVVRYIHTVSGDKCFWAPCRWRSSCTNQSPNHMLKCVNVGQNIVHSVISGFNFVTSDSIRLWRRR